GRRPLPMGVAAAVWYTFPIGRGAVFGRRAARPSVRIATAEPAVRPKETPMSASAPDPTRSLSLADLRAAGLEFDRAATVLEAYGKAWEKARASILARASEGGKISADRLDALQEEAHALAMLAIYRE